MRPAILMAAILIVLVGCWAFHPVEMPSGMATEEPVLFPALSLEIGRVDTNADRVTVTGLVVPPEAEVRVGDIPAKVDADGRFTATVDLMLGTNFIPVLASWDGRQRLEILQVRRAAATGGESTLLGGVEFSLASAVLTDTVGVEPLVIDAHGQFLVVNIRVKNNRSEPVSLWDEDFVLQDREGRTYRASLEATFAWRAAGGTTMNFHKVSPGTEVGYTLVFDVPDPLPEGLVLRAYSVSESWAAEMAIPLEAKTE